MRIEKRPRGEADDAGPPPTPGGVACLTRALARRLPQAPGDACGVTAASATSCGVRGERASTDGNHSDFTARGGVPSDARRLRAR